MPVLMDLRPQATIHNADLSRTLPAINATKPKMYGLAICTKARIILNHRTRWNDGVFGDDDDAVADGVGVVFCFADVFCVLNGDVFPYARVFVDDCAVDYASRTDADVWDAFLFVCVFCLRVFRKSQLPSLLCW